MFQSDENNRNSVSSLKVSHYFNVKFTFSHQLSLGEYMNEI